MLHCTLHCAHALNNVVLMTVIEMVEILSGRVGKHSVERVKYVINNLLVLHLEIWIHFTHSQYIHLPSARENTDTTHDINMSYFTLTRVIFIP